jgi:hypothetical protein
MRPINMMRSFPVIMSEYCTKFRRRLNFPGSNLAVSMAYVWRVNDVKRGARAHQVFDDAIKRLS